MEVGEERKDAEQCVDWGVLVHGVWFDAGAVF